MAEGIFIVDMSEYQNRPESDRRPEEPSEISKAAFIGLSDQLANPDAQDGTSPAAPLHEAWYSLPNDDAGAEQFLYVFSEPQDQAGESLATFVSVFQHSPARPGWYVEKSYLDFEGEIISTDVSQSSPQLQSQELIRNHDQSQKGAEIIGRTGVFTDGDLEILHHDDHLPTARAGFGPGPRPQAYYRNLEQAYRELYLGARDDGGARLRALQDMEADMRFNRVSEEELQELIGLMRTVDPKQRLQSEPEFAVGRE